MGTYRSSDLDLNNNNFILSCNAYSSSSASSGLSMSIDYVTIRKKCLLEQKKITTEKKPINIWNSAKKGIQLNFNTTENLENFEAT